MDNTALRAKSSGSSNQEHRLQHWRAEAPASRWVQGFDSTTKKKKKNFSFHFSHYTRKNQKNLRFCGEQGILICLKPMFHFEFFFPYYIYTHTHIHLHIQYTRLILKNNFFPLLEHVTFLKNFAS